MRNLKFLTFLIVALYLKPCHGFAAPQHVQDIERITGHQIFLTHPVLHLKIDGVEGDLYTYRYPPSNSFSSWLFTANDHIEIVNQSENEDDIMAHDVTAIFNVKKHSSYCIVYMTIDYLSPSNIPAPGRQYHNSGSVYCMSSGVVVREARLSSLLDGIKTAREAKRVLAPYLSK